MLTHQLESAIFHFLKKHYSIGAYFPYSFIKTHFPNETMGDIRKALNWLVDDKLIERIGKGEYKFINNESPSHFEIKEVNPVETQSKEIDKWLIEVIIQTIKKFKKTYNTYFSRDSLYIYSNTNSSREKFDYHIQHMIKSCIVVQDEHGKIIPYDEYSSKENIVFEKIDKSLIDVIIKTIKKCKIIHNQYPSKEAIYFYSNTNSSEKKFFEHIDYMIETCIIVNDNGKIIPYHTYFIKKHLHSSKKESKKTSNKEIDINTEIRKIYGYITKKNKELKKESKKSPEIDINTEIRKIYGYITKKNKELKKEIEQDIEKSLYSAGKEISVLHGNSFAKLMIKINDINQRINYQNQQKDEKIRSLNDKIKTLRKDVNDLIQETKSLKCQNIKKE
jgi:hypothetical protein